VEWPAVAHMASLESFEPMMVSLRPQDASWVKILPTDRFDDPRLGRMLSMWNAKRGDRAMPSRADFDPLDLREHLGWIVLVDVEGYPPRFRYRLIGTRIVDLVGRDVTGAYFDEIYAPEVEATATMSYRDILETKTPNRVTARMEHADKGYLTFEAIDLPLSSDGETVDMILVRSIFDLVPD
jgi:hypothetical protein